MNTSLNKLKTSICQISKSTALVLKNIIPLIAHLIIWSLSKWLAFGDFVDAQIDI